MPNTLPSKYNFERNGAKKIGFSSKNGSIKTESPRHDVEE